MIQPLPPGIRPPTRQRVQVGTFIVQRERHAAEACEASDVTTPDEVVLVLAADAASLELKKLNSNSPVVAGDVGRLAAVHCEQVGAALVGGAPYCW